MTYAERLKAYNDARERLQALEKIESSADYELSELIRRGNWKEHENELDAARAKRDAAREPIPAVKLRAAILRDNARRAFFEEITPQAVEIFQKYAGRPYGEKTRRKIADEIHDKTGFYCYISANSYYSKMQFSAGETRAPWTYDEMEMTLYHGNGDRPPLLDSKNKINMESADALQPYGLMPYVEDPDEQAEKIEAAHKKALAAWETWSAAASAYNDLIPTQAKQIDTRAGKPYPIFY